MIPNRPSCDNNPSGIGMFYIRMDFSSRDLRSRTYWVYMHVNPLNPNWRTLEAAASFIAAEAFRMEDLHKLLGMTQTVYPLAKITPIECNSVNQYLTPQMRQTMGI